MRVAIAKDFHNVLAVGVGWESGKGIREGRAIVLRTMVSALSALERMVERDLRRVARG